MSSKLREMITNLMANPKADAVTAANHEAPCKTALPALHRPSIAVALLAFIVALDVGFSSEFAALFCLVIGSICIVLALTLYASRGNDARRAVPRRGESGTAMVEFALGYSLVLVITLGVIGFGLTFYRYNELQSSMRSAARFASLEPYDFPNGKDWKAAVKNMAVYGDPSPSSGATPLIDGLSTSMIQVTAETPLGVPETVSVSTENFVVNNVVRKFTISKPVVTFPYLGRVTVK